MDTILTLLPASARLYENVLNGIRRRIGTDFELQTVDYEVNKATLKKLLRFWNPAGCIYVGAEGLGKISHAAFGRVPVVYMDRTPLSDDPRLDVVQDYEENGQIAARELIQPELSGYAYVGYKIKTHWSQARGRAFREAIRLNGKECRMFDESNANGDRLKHLERWLIDLKKPIGVFAANDLTADEVLTICKRNQIPIPDEVSLLGIDNVTEICEKASPKISSIASDFEQGGWLCADLLLERICKPNMRKGLRKYPSLGVVTRASTCKTHGFSKQILRAINDIRARACEGLSVDDVATSMGCSRRMAEMRFRQATRMTIKDAITDARLDRAKVLLKDKNMPLSKIVTGCGYGTENAFRIAFKKKFGITLRQGRDSSNVTSERRSEGTKASRTRLRAH